MNWTNFIMPIEDEDGGDPVLSEPELIRVSAVGGYRVRVEGGALLLEIWETLPGEKRITARHSFLPEMALGMAADIRKRLPRRTN